MSIRHFPLRPTFCVHISRGFASHGDPFSLCVTLIAPLEILWLQIQKSIIIKSGWQCCPEASRYVRARNFGYITLVPIVAPVHLNLNRK